MNKLHFNFFQKKSVRKILIVSLMILSLPFLANIHNFSTLSATASSILQESTRTNSTNHNYLAKPSTLASSNMTLAFSSYFGGNTNDYALAIAVDSNGNSYVTGSTSSSNFPMKNAYNATFGGVEDIFLAKFNSTGYLIFSTYLGGNAADRALAIAVDSAGNSYITGYTMSNNFPIKNAYYNQFNGGTDDAFIAKFDSAGNLVFSSYIGGSGLDEGYGIAVDGSGNSYITGHTMSSNFPMKNAYNATFGGNEDVFVAKFDSNGALVFSTFLGGSGADEVQSIAIDSSGNSYITGDTLSYNFPMKNAYNATYGEGYLQNMIF